TLEQHLISIALLPEDFPRTYSQLVVVYNDALGDVSHDKARQSRPHRKVDVFLVQKHIFVETSQPLKQLFANRESGAGACGYIARHSILIGVTAHSSAHRNPAQMDVAAARVDQLGTIGEKNSRSRQSDPFGIKRSNQRVEPSFANGCVWIQEDEML